MQTHYICSTKAKWSTHPFFFFIHHTHIYTYFECFIIHIFPPLSLTLSIHLTLPWFCDLRALKLFTHSQNEVNETQNTTKQSHANQTTTHQCWYSLNHIHINPNPNEKIIVINIIILKNKIQRKTS